jgi:mono/diheme cytochrome c family protein
MRLARPIVSALCGLTLLAAPRADAAEEVQAGLAIYRDQIAPLLKSRCGACHNETDRKSGLSILSLDSLLAGGAARGETIVPGHPEQSVLVKLIKGQLKPRMPLEGEPLSNEEIALVEKWILGLKAPPRPAGDAGGWWAVKSPKSVLPAVQDAGRVHNEIDRFIVARLEKASLSLAPEAGRETLVRRAYFDLLGVPPAPGEVDAFLRDPAPDAWERLIDRLLADPRYGERWGQHWLDLMRYADSGGSEYDREYTHMWRYRDYVVRSFNEDKPYDRFVIEQLAGDEIAPPTIASRVALGFLRLSPEHGSPNKDVNRQHRLNELTAAIGSAFLGVTLSCAQCHEHKYDPITQKDFYRVQAFLVGIRLEDIDLPFEPREADHLAADRARAEADLAQLPEAVARMERELLERLEAHLAAEGVDASQVKARATREELDRRLALAEPESGGPIETGGLRRFTAEERLTLERQRNDLKEATADGVFEKGVARRRVDRYMPRAHVVTNVGQDYFAHLPHLPAAFVRVRGDVDRLGEMVRPGFLSAVTGNHDPATPRVDKFGNLEKFRIGLAEWIASPENPLTARVLVNRVWHHHFGAGLVRTPNNFGRNGAPPSHPELLDWLALRFVEGGWSIKSLHRLMMGSAAYRQISNQDAPEAARADPQNRLVWRMNRRRLEGEAIRDSILSVSGRLNPLMGGPGVFPPLPDGMEVRIYYKHSKFWEPADTFATRRRSVYIFKRRQLDFPLLAALDAPVFNQPSEGRSQSITPLQALALRNGKLVNDEAAHFALRVVSEAGPDSAAQVAHAYRLALARPPTPEESRDALEFLAAEERATGLEGLCRVLFNLNEFVYID